MDLTELEEESAAHLTVGVARADGVSHIRARRISAIVVGDLTAKHEELGFELYVVCVDHAAGLAVQQEGTPRVGASAGFE